MTSSKIMAILMAVFLKMYDVWSRRYIFVYIFCMPINEARIALWAATTMQRAEKNKKQSLMCKLGMLPCSLALRLASYGSKYHLPQEQAVSTK